MADTIKISLELADAAAQKSLSDFITKAGNADKSFKKLGDSGKGTFNEISVGIGKSIGVFDIFAGNLAANVVVGAFNALSSAAGSLFNTFIVDGVKAAQDAENSLNALSVALVSSGRFSADAAIEFDNFSKAIERNSAVDGDLINQNIALLASLTDLDKEGLQRTTQAAVNLSSALGEDLGTVTDALSKAANGNTTTLKRMGIQFEESGTKAATFENILSAIDQRFSGTAQAKVNTYGGAISKAGFAFGDLQEEIGGLITQNPAVVAAINSVTSVLNGSSDSVKEGKQAYKELVAEGLILFIDAALAATVVTQTLVTTGITLFNGFKVAVLGSLAGVAGALSFFSDTAQTAFETFKEGATEAIDEINDENAKKPLDDVALALAGIGNAAKDGLGKLRSEADSSVVSIENATKKTESLTEAQKKANEETNKFVNSLASQNGSVKSVYDERLAQIISLYEDSAVIEEQKGLENFEAQLERERVFNENKQTLLLENLERERLLIEESTVDPSIKQNALLAAEQKFNTDMLKVKTDFSKKSLSIQVNEASQREANQRDTFATIATLSNSNNKTVAAIGKAAALTTLAIDGPVAVGKALAAFPPPFNFAAASAVGAAFAVQAAQVAGVQFASGGIVPGSSFTGDKVQARLNSKEMVLNTSQQSQLFELANGRGSGNSDLITEIQALRSEIGQMASQPISVNVDGREIFNVIRDGRQSGRTF